MTKSTFYCGEGGRDIVCMTDIDGGFTVIASGSKKDMLELARKNNYAVVELRAIRFVQPEKENKK